MDIFTHVLSFFKNHIIDVCKWLYKHGSIPSTIIMLVTLAAAYLIYSNPTNTILITTVLSIAISIDILIPAAYIVEYKTCKLIPKVVKEYITETQDQHQEAFIDSKELGIEVKKTLKSYLKQINCDYIVMLEYHNGSSNIATGNQFCKFDITQVILGDGVKYVQTIEFFTDENILKYDALIDPEIVASKVYTISMDDLKNEDLYSYTVISNYTQNVKNIGLVNLEYDGNLFGTLLFMFNENQSIDKRYMLHCAQEVEELFNNRTK